MGVTFLYFFLGASNIWRSVRFHDYGLPELHISTYFAASIPATAFNGTARVTSRVA
jgi:hypothetical protein